MKMNFKFFTTSMFIIVSVSCYAQAGVYMFSTAIPGAISGGAHNGETAITSYTRAFTLPFSTPNPSTNNGFTILKPYGPASITLKDKLWRGQPIPAKVEFRFYDNNDVMYYKVTLGSGVYVTDITESGEVCPTGCPGITEQIKFEFIAVEERDILANFSRCWNFSTNTPVCPN